MTSIPHGQRLIAGDWAGTAQTPASNLRMARFMRSRWERSIW
jgi:hypothetical protein